MCFGRINNNVSKHTLKIIGYLSVTTLITFLTQLDSLGYDFNVISPTQWIGLIIKSLIPGLVSIKAYLDIPHQS